MHLDETELLMISDTLPRQKKSYKVAINKEGYIQITVP